MSADVRIRHSLICIQGKLHLISGNVHLMHNAVVDPLVTS
jgi:hypothetical protein